MARGLANLQAIPTEGESVAGCVRWGCDEVGRVRLGTATRRIDVPVEGTRAGACTTQWILFPSKQTEPPTTVAGLERFLTNCDSQAAVQLLCLLVLKMVTAP